MNNTKLKFTPKRVTVRMLEAHFSGIQILLDYMNALDNKTSRAVMKKFREEVSYEGQTLDQSEAIFGFLAYLLKNSSVMMEFDRDKRKSDLAQMAMKFVKLNGLAPPSPGYVDRLRIPEDAPVSNIIIPGR